ncbi:hypothetical protein [Paraburkholderia sp. J10-1]|uniref:hypothetical protein n=1 Tax=Paraburkholderia sp. J10-1 TaxID=2805430 RepID=UPI002AB5DF23|nr:hypothetical protein [Paraburkholderia sp. J10-1]
MSIDLSLPVSCTSFQPDRAHERHASASICSGSYGTTVQEKEGKSGENKDSDGPRSPYGTLQAKIVPNLRALTFIAFC